MTKETTAQLIARTFQPGSAFGRLAEARRELNRLEDLAETRALTDTERHAWSTVLDEVIFLEDELEERDSCH